MRHLAAGLGMLAAGCGAAAVPGAKEGDAAVSPIGTDAAPAPAARVVINEIMYHPVLEQAPVDNHEFVELHNPSAVAVSIAGWQLGGDIKYTFPAGATLGPGKYLVVAKNRAMLLAVATYALDPAEVLGDYDGELHNGEGGVSLVDGAGQFVDSVAYADKLPWPISADALGAGADWLKPPLNDLMKYRYLGRSLERYSADAPAGDPASWGVSPPDGATPGRANSLSGPPPAIVLTIDALSQPTTKPLIGPGEKVLVRATFSTVGSLRDQAIEYFVDALDRTDEPRSKVSMAAVGGAFEASLPAQPANSIVRYRVLGNRGGGNGPEIISPRPTDPFEWHTYFVSPPLPGRTPAYQIFISPENWGRMWTNVEPGRVTGCPESYNTCGGCAPNDRWDGLVPAVLAVDGEPYDVLARYQGSALGRTTGHDLRRWTAPGPTVGPRRALGWSLKFPSYRRFHGRGTIVMNKMYQSSPGITQHVLGRIFDAAGLGSPLVKFVRMYVNGGYYNYAMEMEKVDEDMLKRVFPGQPVGDLFKNDGISGDQGPWGWGDGRPLDPHCGFTARQRFERTWERQTHDWGGYDDLYALVEGLYGARAGDLPALRKYLGDKFDVSLVLQHIAIVNWAGAWDDNYHNYYLYRRATDGKWLLLPLDLDGYWGGDGQTEPGSGGSLYIGQQGDRSNQRNGLLWNYFKDSFLRAYRKEYDDRLRELARTIFEPAKVIAAIDEVVAAYDEKEAQASAGGIENDIMSNADIAKTFVQERHAVIRQRLP